MHEQACCHEGEGPKPHHQWVWKHSPTCCPHYLPFISSRHSTDHRMFIEFIRSPPSVLLQGTYTYNTHAKTHRFTCTTSVLNYTVDRATGGKVVLQNWPYSANPTQLRRALLYYTPPQLTAPKSIFFVRTVIPLKTTQVHCYALPSPKKVPSKDKRQRSFSFKTRFNFLLSRG